MSTWSLFSDGSSFRGCAPDSCATVAAGLSSIEAEAGVWLVHNP